MDEKRLELLQSQDWEEIAAKVMNSAISLATRYGWTRDSMLPRGKSIEDLVIEAITSLWEEPERISENCSLSVQLAGIVRGKLWNLAKSADEDVVRTNDLAETVTVEEDDTTELFDEAIELLASHPKVKEREELGLVVLAFSCGTVDVPDIVEETGLSRERVYQLRRELRMIYPSIAKELGGSGEGTS